MIPVTMTISHSKINVDRKDLFVHVIIGTTFAKTAFSLSAAALDVLKINVSISDDM